MTDINKIIEVREGSDYPVLTIHNIAFQGKMSFDLACDLLHIDAGWCGLAASRITAAPTS